MSPVEGQSASLCQISSKSVKRLRRYGDLTVFENGGRPPSWILEIQIILTVWALKRHILHNDAKFREYLSIPCCDIAICVVFEDNDRRHLVSF